MITAIVLVATSASAGTSNDGSEIEMDPPASTQAAGSGSAAASAQPRTAAAAGSGADSLPDPGLAAAGGTSDGVTASASPPARWLSVYGAVAGGVELESMHQLPTDHTAPQNPTLAISRLGVHGGIGEHITFASLFEASLGGPLGYGASVWEGEAELAVLDQWVRYQRGGWAVAVGRVDDPASFDYVSEHVADLLLADMYTRDPLLYSGADRGNGIWASYAITPQLTAGLTLHSTNPTGITGTLIIGGKLVPFDRPFYLAAAQFGTSQDDLPDQNLHIYFGTPSLVLHTEHFDAQTELQLYSLDTQVSSNMDQPIRGFNFRAGARGWVDTAAGRLAAFGNVSRNENEILDPTDSLYRLPDLFKSYTVSSGVDLDFHKHDGVGFQYAMVDTRSEGVHTRQHYLNLGTTFWIEDSLAIGVRAAVFAQQISGDMMTTGERSLFVTARLVLR
ncbi:MAG TPA: hypothetical protein VLX92_30830 [Kofleriaceae bacterium]|nr:hypothetical protein [Kofleriaceae bacterium]